jgi:hypothetical protein|tara:strand:- start:374 stop:586 length:213 start_codon:yes stop_codon:yes gene_type:complete
MAYHIKTPSVMGSSIGDVYYKDESTWTEEYDDRKVFSTKSAATTVKNTTVTLNGHTWSPKHFANATVVTE